MFAVGTKTETQWQYSVLVQLWEQVLDVSKQFLAYTTKTESISSMSPEALLLHSMEIPVKEASGGEGNSLDLHRAWLVSVDYTRKTQGERHGIVSQLHVEIRNELLYVVSSQWFVCCDCVCV